MDIKLEFMGEELQTMAEGECCSLNNFQQRIAIKEEIETADCPNFDENSFVTNEKVEYNIKREPSLEKGGDDHDECEEDSGNTPEDNESPDLDMGGHQNGSSNRWNKNRKITDAATADPTQTMKKIQCKSCDYAASFPSKLRQHVDAVHYRLKPHECKYCDYSATIARDLERHNQAVHQNLKNHKCEYCDYSAALASNLKRHVRGAHYKNKDHKCEHCDYSASQASHLNAHIRIVHYVNRPHKCNDCDYAASTSSNLKKHVVSVHHKLKDHKCQHCSYSTARAGDLKRHVTAVHLKGK